MTLPLEGIRVIDASMVLAAPMSSALLGELGAEVIKVEAPGTGDPTRGFDQSSLSFNVTNRNKRSVTLDLHRPEAVEILHQLCATADAVVINYRPSSTRAWGITAEELTSRHPSLIVLHLTAFGLGGPYEDLPGFGRVAEAFAGLTFITGEADGPPIFPGYPVADGLGGVYGAFLLTVALLHRERTGEGQIIDLGLYEPVLRIMEDFVVNYGATGAIKRRIGNDQPHACPNGLYRTRDDEWVVLPASTANMWDRLLELLDEPELAELSDVKQRIAQRERVDAAVTRLTTSHDRQELLAILRSKGIACGTVNSVEDIANDPHVQARQSLVEVEDPSTGEQLLVQNAAGRFSTFRPRVTAGPRLGEHTAEILESLGIDATERDALSRQQII